eukprot:9791209-Lingulodinium_polyedra.AAC.1
MKLVDWLSQNKALWHNCMPCEQTELIMAGSSSGDVTAVEMQVCQVVHSGSFGLRLFGYMLRDLLAESVARDIDAKIAKLTSANVNITNAFVSDLRQQCVGVAEATGDIDQLPDSRLIKLKYRGTCFVMKISSVPDEIEARINIFLRE